MKTLKDLKALSIGNFLNIVNDLISWYGDNAKIEYEPETYMDTTKIRLTIRTSCKYYGEQRYVWEGKGYRYTAVFCPAKTIVNGFSNSFVQETAKSLENTWEANIGEDGRPR